MWLAQSSRHVGPPNYPQSVENGSWEINALYFATHKMNRPRSCIFPKPGWTILALHSRCVLQLGVDIGNRLFPMSRFSGGTTRGRSSRQSVKS